MSRMGRMVALFPVLASLGAAAAEAQPLTADRAVQLALAHNSQLIQAEASVLDARAGLYGSYSQLLPRVSADLSRAGSRTDKQTGNQLFGSVVTPSATTDNESYSTTPAVSGSWNVLNLSSLAGLSSARSGMKASLYQRKAARSDVVLAAKRQFYTLVSAVHLAAVAEGAARLARDDERRVRALFEVGSVSRSDLLKAQVRTAQSQLDSLTARQNAVNQRIGLAQLLGVREAALGEVDTLLTAAEPRDYAEPALIAEAGRIRPDLLAADAELRAARAGLTSAQLARLPYVTVAGSADFNPRRSFTQKSYGKFTVYGPEYVNGSNFIVRDSIGSISDPVSSGRGQSDRFYSAQIGLTWNLFDGFQTDSRIASARARLLRSQDARDALRRNLESEVHQTLLAYREANERHAVSARAQDSAVENLKLTQQKYNVGSATILELIDAQVQLQRAQGDRISSLAAIRVAEAQIERVRGAAN